MNFVLISDWDKLPYSLPAADIQSTDFEDFMTHAEEKVLRKHLGHLFYDNLIAFGTYLPEEKWAKVIDGSYYEYGGITYKWVGLNKMLVPYLYVMRSLVALDSHTGTGIELPQVENGEKISFRQRAARAWNIFANAYGVCKNHHDSLYGYLQANWDTYKDDGFIYRDPGHMNNYGLPSF